MRGVEKKKYFSKYLICAKFAYKDIFKNTIWGTKSTWQPLKRDDQGNFIDVPSDLERLFSVSETDECGNVVPLWYNNRMRVVTKPTKKACGCDACDCSGLCEDINAMTYTTKEVFTINGITYYEKTWFKFCPNGDVIEYRELPTKKYNSYAGDGGDYNTDYNNDHDIANPGFANFEIVTEVSQRKVCAVTVRACGCPIESPENLQAIQQVCGCAWPFGVIRKKHCDRFLSDINNNCRGEVKLSECQTKIYYRPMPHTRIHNGTTRLPDYLNINYQTNGLNPDGETVIPDYSLDAVFAGTDWYSKRYNNVYSPMEKNEARRMYNDEQNRLILYLNPFSLEVLGDIQDAPTKW